MVEDCKISMMRLRNFTSATTDHGLLDLVGEKILLA